MFYITEKKLISERISDIAYGKILEIIFKHLNKQNVWQPSIISLDLNDGRTVEQVYSRIKYKAKAIQDIWNELEASLSDKEKITRNDIFPSYYFLSKILYDLVLYVRPREYSPGVGGTMSSAGELTLYPRWWNKGRERGDPYAQETVKRLNNGSFFDEHIKNIFTHEFAHYLNAVRSASDLSNSTTRKDFRAKGGVNQFDISKKEYANSTEELQARLAEIFTIIQNILNKSDPKILKDYEKYILYMITAKDIKSFLKFFDRPFLYAYNKELIDKKFYFRVQKRLYTSFIEYTEQKSPIKDYAEKNPKLFYTKYIYIKFIMWYKSWYENAKDIFKSIFSDLKRSFTRKRGNDVT